MIIMLIIIKITRYDNHRIMSKGALISPSLCDRLKLRVPNQGAHVSCLSFQVDKYLTFFLSFLKIILKNHWTFGWPDSSPLATFDLSSLCFSKIWPIIMMSMIKIMMMRKMETCEILFFLMILVGLFIDWSINWCYWLISKIKLKVFQDIYFHNETPNNDKNMAQSTFS